MANSTELIIDLLADLVNSVPDQPQRVLFRGVSDYFENFTAFVQKNRLPWDVLITREGEDVVGARNDATVPILVVFYKDEVKEVESLNAFRQFNENALAAALVTFVLERNSLPDTYHPSDADRLIQLFTLTYPSLEQIANFILAGRSKCGTALPHLGLFADPGLSIEMNQRLWTSRITENHLTAVIRWRDFIEKGQRNRDARNLLGPERLGTVQRAEIDPSIKAVILGCVTLDEALRVLNPPTRLVEALMRSGMLRDEAEELVTRSKQGKLDFNSPPPEVAALDPETKLALERVAPKPDENGEEDKPELENRQVNFCLEGVLRLAGRVVPVSKQLWLSRSDTNLDGKAAIFIDPLSGISVDITTEDARSLSMPGKTGNLEFAINDPQRSDQPIYYFSLQNLAARLEPYAEFWPSQEFWDRAAGLDPAYADLWQQFHALVEEVRNVLDPDWRQESGEDSPSNREPNNPIYLIFDLVYHTNKELFERYLDAWLKIALLPWQAKVSSNPMAWRDIIQTFLDIGLATRSDGSVAVLPFHPLRLIWHRAVFKQIEEWLMQASHTRTPLMFDPGVLVEQLQVVDRPRAVVRSGERLLEAFSAPFYSLFVPEDRHQRRRAPLERARVKLEQFGRMWPFSLDRFHLAFQPGDAGDDVYRLLIKYADKETDAAFRVRAVVDNASTMTAFDRYLLNTGDETTELLTQAHHENLLPRVDYAKGLLETEDNRQKPVEAHAALLVDAFREEEWGYEKIVGRLNPLPQWQNFLDLVKPDNDHAKEQFLRVDLSAPPYHTGILNENQRELVYTPISGDEPEYFRLLYDTLCKWVQEGGFNEGVYYEHVRWDGKALERLHDYADWVILFDRTLEKSLFAEWAKENITLIDYYPNLPGGYRLSVSSRRTNAVEWQLAQVLFQFFSSTDLDLQKVARDMLDTLSQFASGLLLKTLGGGSLAQELLGLYATYKKLVAEEIYVPGRDWLIPLDDYQSWFGRRTQRHRRADLLVLRMPAPETLEMLAVESKWYKNSVGLSFVKDEFGDQGQLLTTVESLKSLFDPRQERLDRNYWQRLLRALLDEAPTADNQNLRSLQGDEWLLLVDGMVFVHQYAIKDSAWLKSQEELLNKQANELVNLQNSKYFSRGSGFRRLRLNGHRDLISMLG
jgi:hypothetical protein